MHWTIKDSITRFKGFFKMVEYHFEVDTYAGGRMSLVREVFDRGTAAAVIAYDPARDCVVLVEQFRPGAHSWQRAWIEEPIAGIVEPGESPIDVVVREAVEEAGCRIERPRRIAHYLNSPGGSSEAVTLFAALCDSAALPEYAGLDSEHEDIRVVVKPREQWLAALQAGAIDNAMTLIAAQWLALNLDAWRACDFDPDAPLAPSAIPKRAEKQ
ncbi:MAG: NUDIX domain-containing protein [Pseudomonadota bacterium]